ncbi:hypothetical protein ACQY0O_000620 [Thecaphora frezii]
MARQDPTDFPKALRGTESIADFYARRSIEGRAGSGLGPTNSPKATGHARQQRSSLSIDSISNRFGNDEEEAEETWTDAPEREPRVYNTFSAASVASRSSLSHRPSFSNLPPSSPQIRSHSASNSPILSSPLTPASSSGAIAGHQQRQESGKRLAGGHHGVSPTLAGTEGVFSGPRAPFVGGKMTKQASWSARSSSPLVPSRKNSEHSLSMSEAGSRRNSAAGLSRSAVNLALRPQTSSLNDQRGFGGPSSAAPFDAASGHSDMRDPRLVGLGLGSAEASGSDAGRGYGWNSERERRDSRSSSGRGVRSLMRDDNHDALSRKGSFVLLGRSGLGANDADPTRSPRDAASGSQRMRSNLGRPSQDVFAISIEQEQAIEDEAASAPRPSAFAKLFRRKGKQNSEARQTGPPGPSDPLQSALAGRMVPLAARPIRPMTSQHALHRRDDASFDEPPLVVLSPTSATSTKATAPSTLASAAGQDPTERPRPSLSEQTEEPPRRVIEASAPGAVAVGESLTSEEESGHSVPQPADRDAPPAPSAKADAAAAAAAATTNTAPAAPEANNSLRVDTTPISGRVPASPQSAVSRSSARRHKTQSSIDSTSSSARRRSLAFLASAISMGSNAEPGATGEPFKSRNPSATSLDMQRPSTAIGTVSPSNSSTASDPKTMAAAAAVSKHAPSAGGTGDAVQSTPIRNPSRSRLVARMATREDEIPSVLTEFLKLDAHDPGVNGRARGQKTAAALYADVNRSSGEEADPLSKPSRTRRADPATEDDEHDDEGDFRDDAKDHGTGSQGLGSSRWRPADGADGASSGSASNLFRAGSTRSAAGSSEAKRSALSASPKTTRTAVRGTFMAAPAGPAMGGYVSPFYVAPLTTVDAGLAARGIRPHGRRASAGSRSIASDESRSIKSGLRASSGDTSRRVAPAFSGSQDKGSSQRKEAKSAAPSSQDKDRIPRKARSHTNLKTSQQESKAAADPHDAPHAADIRQASAAATATAAGKSHERDPPLVITTTGKSLAVSASSSPQNRLRSASSSTIFGQRLFRRPRTAGGDLSLHPVPNLSLAPGSDPVSGQRAASHELTASPTESIEFEMLDTNAGTLDLAHTRRANNGAGMGRLSHDAPRVSNDFGPSGKRDSRGRSNSITSIDLRVPGGRSGIAYGRASSDAYVGERTSNDAREQRGFSPSRLESSGGAAGLFGSGGGGARQRTSSLLPSFNFNRARTSSNAGNSGRSGARSPEPVAEATAVSLAAGLPPHESGPKSFAAALATITAADSASQNALRRKGSFRAAPGSRKGSASASAFAAADGKGRDNSSSLHPEEYVPRLSRESGDEARSVGRLSFSSTCRSSSSRPSFQRRPSSRAHGSAIDLADSPDDQQPPKPNAKPSSKETAPWPDETPEEYALRIAETVPKTEIAAVLASSAEPFYAAALRYHMTVFWFNGNALDIALRKLLMDLHLPKETQQIDRVMEAFAKRYNECNDGLFASDDQPYILSFSLMMLHTDAFNKNAKHKMTKADYLRNTGPSGVPTEILEYLYDNLTFTQFIYVEDRDDLQRRASEAASAYGGSGNSNAPVLSSFPGAGGSAVQGSRARIDPYYLIANGKLGELRADIDQLIPEDTPYSYTGTLADFNIDRLNAAFLHAPSIEIATGRPATMAPPTSSWVGLEAAAHMHFQNVQPQYSDEVVSLKVTKVGVVSRKDDVGDGGRKTASRKWKTCGLLLTGSQLLLFKDIVWTTALQSQILDQVGHSQLSNGIRSPGPDEIEPIEGGVVITPRITYFRPDGVISLADAVAVKDNSYTKYDFVFRLLAARGRQYLIQAQNEDDMNDWIHKINFCACFRTCDLKIRGLDLSMRPSTASGGAASPSPSARRDSRSQARRASAASEARSFTSEGMKLGSHLSSTSDGEGVGGYEYPVQSRSMSPTGVAAADEDQEELAEGDIPGTGSRPLSPTARSRASALTSPSPSQPLSLLQRRLATRRELMTDKIERLTAAVQKVTEVLNEEMRLARHFAVLTPFQKVTRDRIEAAALPLSRKIKQLRLELAKEESRVRILRLDLAAGERLARNAMPDLRLSPSFVSEAAKAPGSQLATPQLLELSGMSESQAGFEEMFGSSAPTAPAMTASRSFDGNMASSIEAAGRARLAQSQRRPSLDNVLLTNGHAAQAPQAAAASSSALSGGRITKPAHQQRHQTNLNSVSEQPADESPVLGSSHQLDAADSSFQSSRAGNADPASAETTEPDEPEGARSWRKHGQEDHVQSASPSRSSVSRSSTSMEGRGDASKDDLALQADEEPEEWGWSKLARNGGNRISLADLPSPNELQEATTRRFIFGVSESSTVG